MTDIFGSNATNMKWIDLINQMNGDKPLKTDALPNRVGLRVHVESCEHGDFEDE